MSELLTPQRPAAASAAEAVALSRRQLWLLLVVTCVPVPALSYAAGIVPLPDLLTRAAVSFVPFIEATTGGGGEGVVRSERVAVGSLTIHSAPADAGVGPQRDGALRSGRSTGARVSAPAKAVRPPALADKTSARGGAGESAPTAGVDPASDGDAPTTATEPDRTGDQQTLSDRGGADAPVATAPAPQAPPADPTTGSAGPGTKPGHGSGGGADPAKQGASPAEPGPASPPSNPPAAPGDPAPPEHGDPPGKPADPGSQESGGGGGRP